MDQTIYLSAEFSVRVCTECDTVYAVLQRYIDERRKDHETFYCPNGHRRHFPQKSDEELLKEQLTHCKADRDFWINGHSREKNGRKSAERSRSALRGVITKMKGKVVNDNGK